MLKLRWGCRSSGAFWFSKFPASLAPANWAGARRRQRLQARGLLGIGSASGRY